MKTSRGNDIYRMDGIGKVFRFTLTQTFKNKGYLISYIKMVSAVTSSFMDSEFNTAFSEAPALIMEMGPIKVIIAIIII